MAHRREHALPDMVPNTTPNRARKSGSNQQHQTSNCSDTKHATKDEERRSRVGRDDHSPRKDVRFEQDDVEPLASKCTGRVRPAWSTADDEDLTFGWDGRHGLVGVVGETVVGMVVGMGV